MTEFVEGWFVAQVLGEGAYGEVRLLVHARSGSTVALKVARGAGGAREARLQRLLRHPHVLRCLGDRIHEDNHYMFLEYAQGGDLFDRIEPDVGTGEARARRYWTQALLGLEYLHGRGVAHRDIKPENLLLDAHDRVKISDFGMATVFRHGGRERLLTRLCGTVPYAAPEVLAAAPDRPYRAEPADLWAVTVVLVAMLAGELPWERADRARERYAAWCGAAGAAAAAADGRPWCKLPASARALVRDALHADPGRRPALRGLLEHPWTRERADAVERTWRSQPCGAGAGDAAGAEEGAGGARELSAGAMEAALSHSQPAHGDDLLVLAPRLLRRMTRLWMRCEAAEALSALRRALHARGMVARRLHPRLLAVDCGHGVSMRAWASPSLRAHRPARSLLEFRRSCGCGLRFKRCFLELSEALRPLVAPTPPQADLFAEPLAEPLTGPLARPRDPPPPPPPPAPGQLA